MGDRDSVMVELSSAQDPLLAEITRRLVDAYDPERIFLFGSAARGDAGPDSDYDIMVLVSDCAPRQKRSGNLAFRALRGIPVPIDVLVWTRSDFEKQLHLKASFPSTILREGKLLYAA